MRMWVIAWVIVDCEPCSRSVESSESRQDDARVGVALSFDRAFGRLKALTLELVLLSVLPK